jgi:hypothetical protein
LPLPRRDAFTDRDGESCGESEISIQMFAQIDELQWWATRKTGPLLQVLDLDFAPEPSEDSP